MQEKRSPERLACFIAGRNLGDIVVQSEFVRNLVARGYAKKFLIWTRPQLAFLFEDIQDCEVICTQFPVGTAKQFGVVAAVNFLRAIVAIRRLRPSVSLDLTGDFRERLFARSAGSPRHIHIGWAPGHPHARLVRNPFGSGRPLVEVPVEIPNVYASQRYMLDFLVPQEGNSNQSLDKPTEVNPANRCLRVGLHPFASQACKLWPLENWLKLSHDLLSRGASVTVFGAPSERSLLVSSFSSLGPRLNLVTVGLPDFARAITKLDVLVGLDSFSVHMAHRQGVRSITINAGTPAQLSAVPTGQTLGSSGGCKRYPCYNISRCEGTSYEYACVKSVSPAQVINAIRLSLGEEMAGIFDSSSMDSN
jgi:heptosyltransferase-3